MAQQQGQKAITAPVVMIKALIFHFPCQYPSHLTCHQYPNHPTCTLTCLPQFTCRPNFSHKMYLSLHHHPCPWTDLTTLILTTMFHYHLHRQYQPSLMMTGLSPDQLLLQGVSELILLSPDPHHQLLLQLLQETNTSRPYAGSLPTYSVYPFPCILLLEPPPVWMPMPPCYVLTLPLGRGSQLGLGPRDNRQEQNGLLDPGSGPKDR